MKKVILLVFIVSLLAELLPAWSTRGFNLQDTGSGQVHVCTFNGQDDDVIHEVVVCSGSSMRITLPGSESVKQVVYDEKLLNVTGSLDEVIVRPKQESLTAYLAVLTGDNHAYIFKIEAVKKGDKSQPTEQQIIIRR
jgi:type IV secretory pathway VirB9-like protein